MFGLEFSAITQHGMLTLAELLKRNTTLKHLTLKQSNVAFRISKNRNIETTGLPIFADALAHCHLQKVRLHNFKNCTPDFTSSICNGLSQNTTIRSLCLGACIGVNAALGIGNALKVNNSILLLELVAGEISDLGIKHICDGLQQNCTVTEFRIACTRISSKGVITISEMLKKNTSIKKLQFGDDVQISNEAKATFVRTVMEDDFTLHNIIYLSSTIST